MKEISNQKRKKKGFTLIELIIVIAIIGILAVIAVPRFADIQKNSKIKADIATGKVVHDAVVVLLAENKVSESDFATETLVSGNSALEGYLQKEPVSQVNKDGVYAVKIESGKIIVYVQTAGADGAATNKQVYPDAEAPYVTE